MRKRYVCIYLIVVIAIVAFVSCSRQDQAPPQLSRPYPAQHPLAGQEIQFDSLVWQREDFFDNVFISIDNRQDIFMYPAATEVSLRLDTSSTWILVNPSSGYFYSIRSGRFYIAPDPWNTTLDGRYASIKIKF